MGAIASIAIFDEGAAVRAEPALSPAVAAEVFAAARGSVPPRWLAPGERPLWTLGTRMPSPPAWHWSTPELDAFTDLRAEVLKCEANVRLVASYLLAFESYELDLLYGNHPSRPAPMTFGQACAKAVRYLDNHL